MRERGAWWINTQNRREHYQNPRGEPKIFIPKASAYGKHAEIGAGEQMSNKTGLALAAMIGWFGDAVYQAARAEQEFRAQVAKED